MGIVSIFQTNAVGVELQMKRDENPEQNIEIIIQHVQQEDFVIQLVRWNEVNRRLHSIVMYAPL